MEIRIAADELRAKKLMVATPMYGGICHGQYSRSMIDLALVCQNYGIELQIMNIFNESLITRARNYCADAFMRSGCTHLMFIDSDIGFNPNDVISLLALQSDESEYDIIGGPYPKKNISWEKIKLAVDKGFADDDPNNLEKFVGDYVFNPKGNQTRIQLDVPAEVSELGTGFMMIRRKTFEKYQEAYPELMYRPDHIRSDEFDGSREIMAFFDCEIDPVTKRYLSEDYFFCYRSQKAGMKTWLCPWMSMAHNGTYTFAGSLRDLAAIGAPATADHSMLKKKRK